MTTLGTMYAIGQGVRRDYAQALSWLGKAATAGDPSAMNNLGVMYQNGQGVRRDYAQAMSWFRKAADKGFAPAMTAVGLSYYFGNGVPRDYAQAAEWYRRAADAGDPSAMNNLGTMYDKGRGVPQNYTLAVMWFRRAADKGYALAMTNLGVMYQHQRGVKGDSSEADRWFREAAAARSKSNGNVVLVPERLPPGAESYAAARARCRAKASALDQSLCDQLTPEDVTRSEASANGPPPESHPTGAQAPTSQPWVHGISPERWAAARERCRAKVSSLDASLCDQLTPEDVIQSEAIAGGAQQ